MFKLSNPFEKPSQIPSERLGFLDKKTPEQALDKFEESGYRDDLMPAYRRIAESGDEEMKRLLELHDQLTEGEGRTDTTVNDSDDLERVKQSIDRRFQAWKGENEERG